MTITVYPTKFEAYDNDLQEGIFTVEAFDDCAANVKISSILDVAMWDEISPMIRKCLVDMKLGE